MRSSIRERPVDLRPEDTSCFQISEAAAIWGEELMRDGDKKKNDVENRERLLSLITGTESLFEISNLIEDILVQFEISGKYLIDEEELWNEYWKKKGIDPKFMDAARRKFDKKEEESSVPPEGHETGKVIQDLDRLEKKIDGLGNEISDFTNKISEDLPVKGSVECHITKTPEKGYLAANFFPIVLTILFAAIGTGILTTFGITSFWLRAVIMQIPIMFFYSLTQKSCGTINWETLKMVMKFSLGLVLGLSFISILYVLFVFNSTLLIMLILFFLMLLCDDGYSKRKEYFYYEKRNFMFHDYYDID